MTRRVPTVLVAAVALTVAGCATGDDEAVPSVPSPADAVADTADAAPTPTAVQDSTVDDVPASSIVEPGTDEQTDTAEAVTTEPPTTVATDTTAPATTAPSEPEEPEETVPDEPSSPPVSAAEIADLERQLDEIDALLTDLEFDLDQD